MWSPARAILQWHNSIFHNRFLGRCAPDWTLPLFHPWPPPLQSRCRVQLHSVPTASKVHGARYLVYSRLWWTRYQTHPAAQSRYHLILASIGLWLFFVLSDALPFLSTNH